jgi:hypothetical protein
VTPCKTVISPPGQPLFSNLLNYVRKKGAPVARYFAGSGTPFLPLFRLNHTIRRIFHGRGHHFHSSRK